MEKRTSVPNNNIVNANTFSFTSNFIFYNSTNSSIEVDNNLWMVSEEKGSGITFFCKSKLTTPYIST